MNAPGWPDNPQESDRLDALLILTLCPGLGATLTARAIETLGSPGRVVGASAEQLQRVKGIGGKQADTIARGLARLSDGQALAQEKQLLAQFNTRALPLGHPDYPALLRHTPDPPPLLYVRGEIKDEDGLSLAIVGSRKCTAYGKEQAGRFAAYAADAGLTVVSGGAYGIDAAAHHAALRVKGRTIAVLGSGIARPYPSEHAELFDRIAEPGDKTGTGCGAGNGAVVSEFPMTTAPQAQNFPRRNRVISGLSLGTLVVEAAKRSGALITARLAAEDHGREVMALPGRVDSPASAGCNKIIRDGWATLVTSGADVLDQLGDAGRLLKQAAEEQAGKKPGSNGLFEKEKPVKSAGLTRDQQRVLDVVNDDDSVEAIAVRAGLPIHTVQSTLTILEMRRLVARRGGRISKTDGVG